MARIPPALAAVLGRLNALIPRVTALIPWMTEVLRRLKRARLLAERAPPGG